MGEVKVLNFHVRYLDMMDVRGIELKFLTSSGGLHEAVENLVKSSIQAGVFIRYGRILCVAGFYQIWPGLLEFWLIPSVYAKEEPMFFCRTVKRYVENIAETFKAHRVQTTSYDDPMHERFMGFLGFKSEGTLVNYLTDKTTMRIYARLF